MTTSRPSESNAERARLAEDERREKNWKRWGPYLSERQWGTVREDYSADGKSWEYFSHDQARSRAYRWGEDGLLGICDRQARLCFGLALWNERDPILKERLFGLTGPEGNHGEDVKELYYYLDATPTSSYLAALYKYPQGPYPYADLVSENARRGRNRPEYELLDTGAFAESRYFDVLAEYAKASEDDILVSITVHNRGPEDRTIHVLPTLWFRNTWGWGRTGEGYSERPELFPSKLNPHGGTLAVETRRSGLRDMRLYFEPGQDAPELLFTDNETNTERLFGTSGTSTSGTPGTSVPSASGTSGTSGTSASGTSASGTSASGTSRAPGTSERRRYTKDAFHEYVVNGRKDAVNPDLSGTKMAAHYRVRVPKGGQVTLRARLVATGDDVNVPFGAEFDRTLAARKREADEFYADILPPNALVPERNVARQAYAGLFWSKQFYHYSVREWLDGDPGEERPPSARAIARNQDFSHVYCRDVISMPDAWEYPWFAAWDLAFHMIPFAKSDAAFAKDQLLLLLREWYMHPNGQLPAYEWAFGDVNPPVHAWAAFRVYKMSARRGERDVSFLGRVFQKLLLNFTWWVNRKDEEGNNLFAGGFLGLDNIGIFDRSKPLPTGGHLEQADGTAWMAFYSATMLAIALELAQFDACYEDMASKFFEHFISIVDAMNSFGGTGLWDEVDGFYYDRLHTSSTSQPLRTRSMVGVIPLFAVEVLDDALIDRLPGFKKRMQWFLENRKDLSVHISYLESDGSGCGRRLLAVPSRERLERVLRYVLDEAEFLSPHGIRSLSRVHKEHPFVLNVEGTEHQVNYTPGDSDSWLFGGNSNWRGPVWFPLNYLLVEALERYHHFYGDSFKVECPTGSGIWMDLSQVAGEIATRLSGIFLPDAEGARPCHGGDRRYAEDPNFRDLLLFSEYFNGDDGRGVGASHQTGWTALVIGCLEGVAQRRKAKVKPAE